MVRHSDRYACQPRRHRLQGMVARGGRPCRDTGPRGAVAKGGQLDHVVACRAGTHRNCIRTPAFQSPSCPCERSRLTLCGG